VDEDWAKGVLRWWVACAEGVLGNGESMVAKGPPLDGLRERENLTQRVVQQAFKSDDLPVLIRWLPAVDEYELASGVEKVKYALGILNSRDEIEANFRSRAPTMAADALHPTVWDAASKYWSDGHYGAAVQRAATFLNAHVQDLTSRNDVADSNLMAQTFSPNPPDPGKPRLRWPGDDGDLTVKAMRAGILNFSQGCYMAIRNPATHSTEDLPKQIALEQLAVLSTLARWIDGCELVKFESHA
jgi:hypothetical protein